MAESFTGPNHITRSAVIRQNRLYQNGRLIGELPGLSAMAFADAAYEFRGMKYPKFYKMDNLSKLGMLASDLLLQDLPHRDYLPEDLGIVLQNNHASLDTDIRYYKTVSEYASPALFVYTLPNIVIGEISIRHRFKGENAFFIAREFDPAFIRQYVDNLINNNILQCCICGWVDWFREDYNAVLYLVERPGKPDSGSRLFTEENMLTIYQMKNG